MSIRYLQVEVGNAKNVIKKDKIFSMTDEHGLRIDLAAEEKHQRRLGHRACVTAQLAVKV